MVRYGGRGTGGPRGHVALEGTLYSRVTCPGGRVTLVQSVRGDTVHWGTDSTPTTTPEWPCMYPHRDSLSSHHWMLSS